MSCRLISSSLGCSVDKEYILFRVIQAYYSITYTYYIFSRSRF